MNKSLFRKIAVIKDILVVTHASMYRVAVVCVFLWFGFSSFVGSSPVLGHLDPLELRPWLEQFTAGTGLVPSTMNSLIHSPTAATSHELSDEAETVLPHPAPKQTPTMTLKKIGQTEKCCDLSRADASAQDPQRLTLSLPV